MICKLRRHTKNTIRKYDIFFLSYFFIIKLKTNSRSKLQIISTLDKRERDTVEIEERDIIGVSYVNTEEHAPNGVKTINLSTFQVVSTINIKGYNLELPLFKLDVNRVLIGNSPVRLLDLENNTIEDKTDELFRADCFAKVNDEFVIYGGIYRFFF